MELDEQKNKATSPRLTLRAEFEEALRDYHPSEHARQVIKGVTFAVMTGPTAAGRNTIIWKLLETKKYHYVVSDTTRPKRVNDGKIEQNGHEYWFRSESEFLSDLQAGEFLEAEIIHNQQVSGISIRELERARDEDKVAITDVDIEGIQNALNAKSDSIALLVFPPDFDTWQQRLAKRGEMDSAELRRRLETAARIFALPTQDERYRIIINDTIDNAVSQARDIIEGNAVNQEFQAKARKIALRLEQDTLSFIQQL
jgi:guanylate kinase